MTCPRSYSAEAIVAGFKADPSHPTFKVSAAAKLQILRTRSLVP